MSVHTSYSTLPYVYGREGERERENLSILVQDMKSLFGLHLMAKSNFVKKTNVLQNQ